MLVLRNETAILRDFIESDIADHIRWETDETEWKLWTLLGGMRGSPTKSVQSSSKGISSACADGLRATRRLPTTCAVPSSRFAWRTLTTRFERSMWAVVRPISNQRPGLLVGL